MDIGLVFRAAFWLGCTLFSLAAIIRKLRREASGVYSGYDLSFHIQFWIAVHCFTSAWCFVMFSAFFVKLLRSF